MYSCGSLHKDEQRQDDQLEPTYSSSVPIQDVALSTSQKQWTIGRGSERGSGIFVLIVRHDDIYIYIYIYYALRRGRFQLLLGSPAPIQNSYLQLCSLA